MIQDKAEDVRNCFSYTWVESEAGRGSNEICSALLDFLKKIERRARTKKYRRLCLISESCGGQNKNRTMIGALLSYANSKINPFKEIDYLFPIPGHLYMAPDRLFGRIEKDIKKQEEILIPAGYHEIMAQHSVVHKYGQDFKVYDYKKLSETILQKSFSIGIREHRMWRMKKNVHSFWYKSTYSGSFTAKKKYLCCT